MKARLSQASPAKSYSCVTTLLLIVMPDLARSWSHQFQGPAWTLVGRISAASVPSRALGQSQPVAADRRRAPKDRNSPDRSIPRIQALPSLACVLSHAATQYRLGVPSDGIGASITFANADCKAGTLPHLRLAATKGEPWRSQSDPWRAALQRDYLPAMIEGGTEIHCLPHNTIEL